MFWRLIMAIFRLYMNHLVSSYIYIYMGYLYGGGAAVAVLQIGRSLVRSQLVSVDFSLI